MNKLRPHEQVKEDKLIQVLGSISSKQDLNNPIIVDRNTKIILDGHHRAKAFQIRGIRRIPCTKVDYKSDKVSVKSRTDKEITKQDVIRIGLSDSVYPPKTTKHTLDLDNKPQT